MEKKLLKMDATRGHNRSKATTDWQLTAVFGDDQKKFSSNEEAIAKTEAHSEAKRKSCCKNCIEEKV